MWEANENYWPIQSCSVWRTGWKVTNRKLEAVQERVGRKLLGVSRTVAGAAIWGDLGWKRLEERREEKVLYGRRLQRVDDSSLAK